MAQPVTAPSRVPNPTPLFWAAKAASTALGEAVSDFAVRSMAPELAVVIGFIAFCAALWLQLTRRRYLPAVYWLTVAMVGIFGTMAADVVHVVTGMPYVVTTVGYALVLAVVFWLWHRVEGTLSVHRITTTRRELFYWAAVVATFALGTALGDFAAVGLGLGYLPSIVLFAALIAVPALAYRFAGLNSVLAFWAAYVLTRPFGASVADWLAKPVAEGGLGVGSGAVSLILAVVLAALVVVMLLPSRTSRRLAAS